MRGGILTVGIILLIIGGIMFFEGYNQVKEYQSTLGQIGRVVSENAREEYNNYKLMEEYCCLWALLYQSQEQ